MLKKITDKRYVTDFFFFVTGSSLTKYTEKLEEIKRSEYLGGAECCSWCVSSDPSAHFDFCGNTPRQQREKLVPLYLIDFSRARP